MECETCIFSPKSFSCFLELCIAILLDHFPLHHIGLHIFATCLYQVLDIVLFHLTTACPLSQGHFVSTLHEGIQNQAMFKQLSFNHWGLDSIFPQAEKKVNKLDLARSLNIRMCPYLSFSAEFHEEGCQVPKGAPRSLGALPYYTASA